MTKLTETPHAGEYVVSEANGRRSREEVTITGGSFAAGTVLGFVGGAATAAAVAGNTGNGTLTMDATHPTLAGATPGVYTVRATAAAANGGTFEVNDPDGNSLGSVDVGDTFASQVKFTIADGATDFAVGDGFDITVPSTGNYTQLDTDAVDGSSEASAILYAPVDASDDDVPGVITARESEVNGHLLVWPDGISNADKASAIVSLADAGIIVR